MGNQDQEPAGAGVTQTGKSACPFWEILLNWKWKKDNRVGIFGEWVSAWSVPWGGALTGEIERAVCPGVLTVRLHAICAGDRGTGKG